MGRQASSAVTVTDGETVSLLHTNIKTFNSFPASFISLAITCLSLTQFVIC